LTRQSKKPEVKTQNQWKTQQQQATKRPLTMIDDPSKSWDLWKRQHARALAR